MSIRTTFLATAAMALAAPDTATSGEMKVTEITIQGLSFEVSQPYSAGPCELTEGEANALNQTRAENLRNNFAPKVKAAMAEYRKANGLAEDAEIAVTDLDHDALQASFSEYAEGYEFSLRQGGGGPRTPTDPVEREAQRIAWDKIKIALGKQNIRIDSVSKEKKAELISGVISKYPEITEEARRRVSTAADIALDGLSV